MSAVKRDRNDADNQKRLMATSMGLDRETYIRRPIVRRAGDYGADPIGGGMFRMVPSGDVVDAAERKRRLGEV
jgi:hypothetical protein